MILFTFIRVKEVHKTRNLTLTLVVRGSRFRGASKAVNKPVKFVS